MREVLRTQAPWAVLWARIWSTREPVPAVPVVDFSREVVVFASMGVRSSSGYDIRVDSAAVAGGELHVYVTERSPLRCVRLTVMTQPYHAVAIAAPGLPVLFHEQTAIIDCSSR